MAPAFNMAMAIWIPITRRPAATFPASIIAGAVISACGTDEQKARLLPGLADGSVKFVSNNINTLIWNYAGARADGNVLGDW